MKALLPYVQMKKTFQNKDLDNLIGFILPNLQKQL